MLFTHPHADHIHGIDELRNYNYVQKTDIPVYGNEWTAGELQKKFEYIFSPVRGAPEGGIVPQLRLQRFDAQVPRLDIAGVAVTPVSLQHGSKECVAFRVGALAYVTDCNVIPSASRERLRGLEILVLDCVRLEAHRTHLNLDGALEIIRDLKPRKTYLTHLGHDFDYPKVSKQLPKGVFLAYDGLKLTTRGESV